MLCRVIYNNFSSFFHTFILASFFPINPSVSCLWSFPSIIYSSAIFRIHSAVSVSFFSNLVSTFSLLLIPLQLNFSSPPRLCTDGFFIPYLALLSSLCALFVAFRLRPGKIEITSCCSLILLHAQGVSIQLLTF